MEPKQGMDLTTAFSTIKGVCEEAQGSWKTHNVIQMALSIVNNALKELVARRSMDAQIPVVTPKTEEKPETDLKQV